MLSKSEYDKIMDDLDKHLAELQLINSIDLPPNPNSGQYGTLGKKMGPAVPPKPKKTQPEVPHSTNVKSVTEPSYASRLQSPHLYFNLPPQSTQTQQQSPSNNSNSNLTRSNVHSHSTLTYSNVSQQNNKDLQQHYSNYPPESSDSALSSHPVSKSVSPTLSRPASNISHTAYRGSNMSHNSDLTISSNLPSSSTLSNSNLSLATNPANVATYAPKPYTKPEQHHVTYSNVQVGGGGPIINCDGLIYSNLVHPPREGVIYSNLPTAGNGMYSSGADDLPPPPPPPPEVAMGDYAPCTVNTNLPPPPDDLPPPPSPVSSSYSELRRATHPGQDYPNYGLGSQSSSTYESIYEPINPRPPSQMSSRSNYSLYAPYVSAGSNVSGPSQSASRIGVPKEQEVDVLTDLLVQGMQDNVEVDFYGICVKCGEKVVGENSGCTAMDKIYHTKCFTCHQCAVNLQGKPFYSLDGKPYCEEDYLNTLEKCSVCMKPILDRILRATGKPYHPKCFCCVICGKSLDGIPFTVDATNQIHCIEDFHKKFAPRCCVCKQPIMPEPGQEETVRVVALDRSFHIQCYKCEDCGLVLSSESEGRGCYPLDDHVLCKSCNAKRVQALTRHMTTEL
ncbi:thyroid receptor-interacting protein 6 [Agrilus planipennis]|uniref:Thyroid receptor-interacting protein 6 n=1 Tax=Agrilus planipennis TaxID=224129 RepID=A0A1W4XMI9_AGRPL|nr:thyroid receptor-interacting protein 6 [Agrilus planipennis]